MSQVEEIIEEQPIVPGTEGTEMEGLSEEEIERKLFDKVVEEDDELDDPLPAEPIVEDDDPEPDPDPDPKPDDPEDPKPDPKDEPTGLEWIDDLPEEAQAKAKDFIGRQGETIARLDQRVSSHLGQLQPAQRTISRLINENNQLKEDAAKAQPTAPNVEDRIEDYNTWVDSEYSEFPEEAAKLKAHFKESLDGIPEALQNANPEPRETPAAGPDVRNELQHLATAYSDWGERRFSPEFDEWVAGQPPDARAQLNSPYASDNIALLDGFTRDNPNWVSPQTPEDFHSLRQAQFSPLFRGWAEGEGINPDVDASKLADHHRDNILTRFKTDLGTVVQERQQETAKATKLKDRRREQLNDRNPGSKHVGVKPGQKIDLNTKEGQRAYYQQLIASDPDLN